MPRRAGGRPSAQPAAAARAVRAQPAGAARARRRDRVAAARGRASRSPTPATPRALRARPPRAPARASPATQRREVADAAGRVRRRRAHAAACVGRAQPPATPQARLRLLRMGAQWWGMGRELLRDEPVFAAAIDECDALLAPLAGWSLRASSSATRPLARRRADVAHVANLALQLGLAALWRSWGIVPDAVARPQLRRDGGRAASPARSTSPTRSRSRSTAAGCSSRTAGSGGMLAAGVAADEAAALLARLRARVSRSRAVNGPGSVRSPASSTALGEIAPGSSARGRFGRMLDVTCRTTAPQMDALRDELLDALASAAPAHAGDPARLDRHRRVAERRARRRRLLVAQRPPAGAVRDGGASPGRRGLRTSSSSARTRCSRRGRRVPRASGEPGAVLPCAAAQASARGMLRTLGALHVRGPPVDWAARASRAAAACGCRRTVAARAPLARIAAGHRRRRRRRQRPHRCSAGALRGAACRRGRRRSATSASRSSTATACRAPRRSPAPATSSSRSRRHARCGRRTPARVARRRASSACSRCPTAPASRSCVRRVTRPWRSTARADAADDWTLRASARIAAPALGPAAARPRRDPRALRRAESIPTSSTRRCAIAAGSSYGARFGLGRAVARRRRGARRVARAPPASRAARWRLHPALLDAAFQASRPRRAGTRGERRRCCRCDRPRRAARAARRRAASRHVERRAAEGDAARRRRVRSAADGGRVLATLRGPALCAGVGARGRERLAVRGALGKAGAAAGNAEPACAPAAMRAGRRGSAAGLDAHSIASGCDGYYGEVEPALERLAARSATAALRTLGLGTEAGATIRPEALGELGVAASRAASGRAAAACPGATRARPRARRAASAPGASCERAPDDADAGGKRSSRPTPAYRERRRARRAQRPAPRRQALRGEEDAREWLVAGPSLRALTELYRGLPRLRAVRQRCRARPSRRRGRAAAGALRVPRGRRRHRRRDRAHPRRRSRRAGASTSSATSRRSSCAARASASARAGELRTRDRRPRGPAGKARGRLRRRRRGRRRARDRRPGARARAAARAARAGRHCSCCSRRAALGVARPRLRRSSTAGGAPRATRCDAGDGELLEPRRATGPHAAGTTTATAIAQRSSASPRAQTRDAPPAALLADRNAGPSSRLQLREHG